MSLPSPFWTEQRRERRIPTAVPVCFEWLTVGGELLRTRGVTRDVSETGLYSYVEHPLLVGLQVQFDILFPAELAGDESLLFRCRGQVLRCERLHNRFGVAVSLHSHQIIETIRRDRRSYSRISPASPVVAAYAGLRAAVTDLSRTGAFIEDPHPPAIGQKIELRLHAQEWKGEIVVQAVVRRVEPNGGMGVEFVALTGEADRHLQAFVENDAATD